MKIFLDDQGLTERANWVPVGWVVATNFAEFKALLEKVTSENGRIEAISFDNDLGDGSGELTEGLEIMKWCSEYHPELFNPGVIISVHSQNRPARENMEAKLTFWQTHYADLLEAKNRPDPWAKMK